MHVLLVGLQDYCLCSLWWVREIILVLVLRQAIKKIENLQIATLETNIERGERVFSNKQRDSLVYQRETVHIA